MAFVFNIRGTNGSGKSTLARAFLPPNLSGDREGGPVDLNWYDAPTKKDPARRLRVEGYVRAGTVPNVYSAVGVVGPYRTACGGLDAVPSFGVQQDAIRYMLTALAGPVQNVIAEGVLASTVFGSWADFDLQLETKGHHFVWVYLHTPIDVCLQRIKQRQAAGGKEREIKEDLVRDKQRAILATRTKALAAQRLVYDIPYDPTNGGREVEALRLIMDGRGEQYNAHNA